MMSQDRSLVQQHALPAVLGFALAFAWVEASVVVYLRDLYYPDGFRFPLRQIDPSRIGVELVREFATLAMLGAVGFLAGSTRWQRFAYAAISFGMWDIFFYVWLKISIDWPSSFLDWDILFLLPVPWIGPVLAPVIVSGVLIVAGSMILGVERRTRFRPSPTVWAGAVLGSCLVLWSFMRDTAAGFSGAMPEPYPYSVFLLGISCYLIALGLAWRGSRRPPTVA